MQESDAIHLVCYMELEDSRACVLHSAHKFWNYRDSTTVITWIQTFRNARIIMFYDNDSVRKMI